MLNLCTQWESGSTLVIVSGTELSVDWPWSRPHVGAGNPPMVVVYPRASAPFCGYESFRPFIEPAIIVL